jgi:hypothetical protein
MSKKTVQKQFQYEIQAYQEDCVNHIISIFEKLRQSEGFEAVLKAHHSTYSYNFPVQNTKNLDIMMETGTGKTFTFIKTIFELNKNFDYNNTNIDFKLHRKLSQCSIESSFKQLQSCFHSVGVATPTLWKHIYYAI